ncbi:hypothetical protein EMIT0P218_60338 [Pseudomonas sp. IT-P218]
MIFRPSTISATSYKTSHGRPIASPISQSLSSSPAECSALGLATRMLKACDDDPKAGLPPTVKTLNLRACLLAKEPDPVDRRTACMAVFFVSQHAPG